jgi:hypothetical protein
MPRPLRAGLVSAASVVAFFVVGLSLRASENIDYDAINKMKTRGLVAANSQVMQVASYLTDVYGPRLTGSPNIKLRRTVRIGLWTGEEQGLLGSRDYVQRHFGSAGAGRGGGGAAGATPATPAFTPEHAKFAAYFNRPSRRSSANGWRRSAVSA